MMRRLLKNLVIGFFKLFNLSITFNPLPIHEIIEQDYGFFKSYISKRPMRNNGTAIPWFTYPSIEFLDQLDLRGLRVFEWGSGASSSFFLNKGCVVVSVENQKKWFEEVSATSTDRHDLILHVNPEDYVREISKHDNFDLIVIDGIERESCSKLAVNKLKEGGVIILDNAERHPDIGQFLRDQGFIEIDFHGMGPINNYCWTTSVFLHRNYSIKPISIQPVIPIGGINV